jgi:hypothetical protein
MAQEQKHSQLVRMPIRLSFHEELADTTCALLYWHFLKIKKTSTNMNDSISFPFVFSSQYNTDTSSLVIIYNMNGASLLDARRTCGVDREFLKSTINYL